jgi:hypothetical protein
MVGGVIAGGATTGATGADGARDSAGGRTGKDRSGVLTAGGAIVGTVFGDEPDDDETGCGVGSGSIGGKLVEAGVVVLGFVADVETGIVEDGTVGDGIVAEGIPAAG